MTKEVYFLPMIRPHRLFVLAYEGCQLLDVTGPAAVFGAANEAALREALEEGDDAPETDAAEDEDDEIAEPPPAVMARRAPEFSAPSSRADLAARPVPGVSRSEAGGRRIDTVRLETALQDLIACRQLLDSALKDG